VPVASLLGGQHQAMLNRKVETLQATIAELKSTNAQQKRGMDALTAQLKEQAAQIQKRTSASRGVSANEVNACRLR